MLRRDISSSVADAHPLRKRFEGTMAIVLGRPLQPRPESRMESRPASRDGWRGWRFTPLRIAAFAAGILVLTGIVLFLCFAPNRQSVVIPALELLFDSKITVQKYDRGFFPGPWVVIRGLTLRHTLAPGQPPLATVDRLTMRASYGDLLTPHRIRFISVEGLVVQVPPVGSSPDQKPALPPKRSASNVNVDTISVPGARLLIYTNPPGVSPLRFDIRQLTLHHVSNSRPFQYAVSLHNPLPAGDIEAQGQFGPFHRDTFKQTFLSGDYRFDHAALDGIADLGGSFVSRGSFKGILQHIEVEGTTESPDFRLTERHPSHVSLNFHSIVDGTSGDTLLDPVTADVNETGIESQARVSGDPKKIDLHFMVKNGRVEDLMGLFVHERSPLRGIVSLRASGNAPTQGRDFLQKVYLAGDFGIGDTKFTTPKTQQNVNLLSERADDTKGGPKKDSDPKQEAADARPVVSNLAGHVVLQDGIAHFTNLSFDVPGADVHMRGTFDLVKQRFNLQGTMKMKSNISQATRGVKSLLLKPLVPFFKHKKEGSIVPVSLTGSYDHPNFTTSLLAPH